MRDEIIKKPYHKEACGEKSTRIYTKPKKVTH